MCESDSEMSQLLKQVGSDLSDECYFKFVDAIKRIVPSEFAPIEIWQGLANALAEVSGYRVVLQAAIIEPIARQSESCITGWRNVAEFEPVSFLETSP